MAPAALILLLACLSGTWAVAQVTSTGRAPAGPPGQSLAGSFVVFEPGLYGGATSYQTGLPADFCFRAESYTNDWEYVYNLWLKFPSGWVINSVTVVGSPVCTGGGTWGTLGWSFEIPSNEINIAHPRYQAYTDQCTAYYLVNATPGPGGTDANVSWYWDGDGYNSAPHHPCSSDNYTPPSMSAYPCDQMVNPPAVIPIGEVVPQILFIPDALTASGCPGEPQTHTLHLMNLTGAAGTFDLSYDVTTANGMLTGPASVTVNDGATVDFDVYLTPGSGTIEGEIVTAVVTASGGVYSDSATITKTVDAGGWADIAPDLGSLMDNVSAGYAGLVWSIAGYGSATAVNTYDPAAGVWSAIPASAPPFGSGGYPRSGGQWGSKVYIYGDASAYTGLRSYNMDTNTWLTEAPTGTAPAQPGIWAPSWVADPATGLLYMTGGATTPGGGDLATVYVYDPVLNAWQTPLAGFTTARDFHAAFIFNRASDGHKMLCIVGGVTSASVMLTSTQCYDFTTGVWNAENADVPPLSVDNFGMGYTQKVDPVTGPQLWILGGAINSGATVTNAAYYYDVNTGAWVDGGPYGAIGTYRTSATTLDNQVYKIDGSTGGFTYSNGCNRNVVCGETTACLLSCSATADPTTGEAPLEVSFTSTVDAIDCADPIEYWWEFGDGETSAEANPVHTYAAGTYDWTLTVTSGTTECTTTGTVECTEPVCLLNCSATVDPATGVAPLEVQFTSTVDAMDCPDPIEYWWDFGDGEISADPNPSHTYYDGGWYYWTLTVTSGTTECTTSDWIYVDPFDLGFTDDLGRAQLCANSVTGFYMWFLYTGPYKGYYVYGYAMTSGTPELVTLYSPPWATSWSMLFRYFPKQHRAAGTLYLRGYQLTSAISDRVTTDDPDSCNFF